MVKSTVLAFGQGGSSAMAVEYDLVVIGGSAAGLSAAVAAAHLKARVALVEAHQLGETTFLRRQALIEVGRATRQAHAAPQFGVDNLATNVGGVSVSCDRAMRWAEGVVATLTENDPQAGSAAALATLGVEVIFGGGQFHNAPLCFSVNGRQLRSRAYLIATGTYTAKPNQELQATGYLTSEDILSSLNFTQSQIPPSLQNLLVIGGGLVATELSQTLNRLGSNVTMVVEAPRLLAQEDATAAQLVQAQLEAEGVRILTDSRITQAKQLNGKKWVSTGEYTIEASEILLTVGQRPQVESLNLESVGVQVGKQGVQVNEKLQTSHPRIYACGEVIGGYPLPHVARYEAAIALKNALFFPKFKVNYRAVPWAVFSDPELARVGLTEAQARHRYGQIQVLQQFYKTIAKSQLRGETTGFCKMIVFRDGTILGAHLVGSAAAEVVHLIALAMQQRLKVKALSDLVHISPTFLEINFKTATEWGLGQQSARQDWLESWFNLRRAWSS
ncbi:Mercuric ion reductase [uncultured Synechococcales cyanobacterium]|uniref:Mercuric ion reductase n=1 Tax=uncultured Synechococcales cyanobacterium TaxID=1936017 RepID=A0A6J4V421_9CYAN|nr:Mercuric ion reductase [uncultured Synechococcales cyanobacterium]